MLFRSNTEWQKYKEEAKKIIKPRPNTQKGQIARYICKKVLEDKKYKPVFLQGLVNEIQEVKETEPAQSIEYDDLPF